MSQGTGAWTGAQVHAGRGAAGEQCGQQTRVALGVGLSLGAAVRAGAGNQAGEFFIRRAKQAQLGQLAKHGVYLALRNIGQQQALPGRDAQGAIAPCARKRRSAT
ncbi:hypothetical protein D3C77_484890 [compost metagenome]